MLQRFCKTLYASISTAHKAYLETSVGVVFGVVRSAVAIKSAIEAWDVL